MFEFNIPTISPEIEHQLNEENRNRQLRNEIAKTNNAEYMAKVIGQRIVDFQSALSEVQDVALQIIQFNNSITLYVTEASNLDCWLTAVPVAENYDSNNELQRANQILKVLMAIVPKPPKPVEIPHRKIGF